MLLAVVMIAAYRWLVRRSEQRSPQELPVRGAGVAAAAGVAGGLGLFALVYAILW